MFSYSVMIAINFPLKRSSKDGFVCSYSNNRKLALSPCFHLSTPLATIFVYAFLFSSLYICCYLCRSQFSVRAAAGRIGFDYATNNLLITKLVSGYCQANASLD